MHICGENGNHTDLTVQLHTLSDPEKETIFENCVADVNIPVGEVFTSPVLEGTNGVLHVSKVYLNELQYKDLEITFSNGMVADYRCSNFEREIMLYIVMTHWHLENSQSEQIRLLIRRQKNMALRIKCRF